MPFFAARFFFAALLVTRFFAAFFFVVFFLEAFLLAGFAIDSTTGQVELISDSLRRTVTDDLFLAMVWLASASKMRHNLSCASLPLTPKPYKVLYIWCPGRDSNSHDLSVNGF